MFYQKIHLRGTSLYIVAVLLQLLHVLTLILWFFFFKQLLGNLWPNIHVIYTNRIKQVFTKGVSIWGAVWAGGLSKLSVGKCWWNAIFAYNKKIFDKIYACKKWHFHVTNSKTRQTYRKSTAFSHCFKAVSA